VRVHPFRESAAGFLMLSLLRSGRRADALAIYESVRGALRDELGIDPGTALQDLYIQVLGESRQRKNTDVLAGTRPGRVLSPVTRRVPEPGSAAPGGCLFTHPIVT
jgi:DNA-binding SARP family transcriptional activator